MVPGQAPADRFGRPEKTKGGSESLGADIAREVLIQGLAEGLGAEGLLQVLGPGGILVRTTHGHHLLVGHWGFLQGQCAGEVQAVGLRQQDGEVALTLITL